MSDEIISLVSDLIVQTQRQKQRRHTACGCANCRRQADDIKDWLDPKKVTPIPVEEQSPVKKQTTTTASSEIPHLCQICLRRSSAMKCKCPYCGAE